MIDTTVINQLVSKLNYEWFKKKNSFFLNEGLYNKSLEKIYDTMTETHNIRVGEDEWKEEENTIIVDVDLKKYCWSSFFHGSSVANGLISESEYMNGSFPVDSRDIANEIVTVINTYTEKFTDVNAIDIVINEFIDAAKAEVENLQISVADEIYKYVMDDFIINLRHEISEKFSHIKYQLNLTDSYVTFERKLTVEVCTQLANFKIRNKRLITSVDGGHDKGIALHYALTQKPGELSNIKLRIEDWANSDVYYLLSRLSDIITDRFSIADIERKKALYLKTGKLFDRNLFDNFKSQKIDTYKDVNKSSIDSQLAALFKS